MVQDNKTFYIEKDTNYALQVECATNINFDDIKRIAKFFVMQLPEAVQNKIYNELDRGVNIIDSEPQLNMYLHSFGNMHQAKMRQAFSNIGNDWFGNKEIEIIDYGCGQALATMLYHDYLQENDISQTVSRITLIEPSEKALCRAGLHTKAFFPDAQINTINKLLNDVAPTEISHSGKPVLHLFSNILDIEAVDLHHLATLAQAENEETDTLWVCISPFFGNHKDNRIPCFLDILNQPKTYTFQRSKGNWQNQWTINCIIAEQKTEENLSTEVTDEDKANGIKDEYGVLYSPDGKRLLKGNYNIISYTVKEGTKVICDEAFGWCNSLQSIVIPDSVTKIGFAAFRICESLQSIVIPDSVTKIGDSAFYYCKSLQSIVIPDSVTKIGNSAFGFCGSLQSIVIPESVTKIGESAFWGCESLQSIIIPESVTKIGESAFGGCESLQSIIIPNSVTEIGDRAFSSCKSLQSIVIPKSVTKIGYRPFNFGIKLTSHSNRFIVENDLLIDLEEKRLIQCLKDKDSIVIPKIVTQIGDWALGGCTSLQSIVIPEAVTEIGDWAFSYCSSLQSIVIPDSVTKIGNYAFEWCSSLQSIVIPKGKKEYFERILDKKLHKLLKEIDEDNLSTEATKEDKANGIRDEYGVLYSQDSKRLLRGNKDITSYTIKKGTKVICDEAFGLLSKSSLQFIVIPDSVTKIGNKAFIGCHSLQNIVIPESVTEIGKWAFEGCQSLQSIVIPESVMQIGDTPFPLGIKITLHSNKFLIKDELLIDLEEKRLIQCLNDKEHIVIPDTITEIGNTAFYEYKSLQNIVIPNSVINIGHSAFYGCESLQSIVIPDSVTEIGNQAFYNCKSLQSIVIPESITKIGDGAFCGCDSLQSIVIPESVTEIGDEAFYVCESLHSIVIPDSITKIGDGAFCGCDSLQSIVIPESVTKIGEGAFAGCESLQNIVIPESVTEVGSSPFPLGIDLTSHSSRFVVENDLLIDLKEKRLIQSLKDKEYAVIPESITTIGDDAFSDCTSLQNLIIPELIIKIGDRALRRCESLQYVVIPDSVTIIGNRAFDSCKVLQSIVIPKSVTEIGKWAFESCSSLQSIVIPNSVTKIGDWTFRNCSSLQSIVIPDSVTEIGNSAFRNCESLQSIVIPDSVTEIGYCAFFGCKSLQSIVIPNSVTKGYCDFSGCSALQSIVIPELVTKIGCEAFLGCSSLQNIVIPDSVTEIGERAFLGCSSLQSIAIPDSVTKIGNFAFGDCKSLQSIVIPDSVTEIGSNAFRDCKSLQSIVIPKSLTTIGDRPFELGIEIRSHSYRFVVEDDLLIDLEEKRLIQCVSEKKRMFIPDSITIIGNNAFGHHTSLKSIVISDSVKIIGNKAFDFCFSLQNIVISNSVTEIGNNVFNWCKSLQNIFITKGKVEYLERILNKEYHYLIKEIDYKNIYNTLAMCYEFGIEYRRDIVKAEEYYAKAKELEDSKDYTTEIDDDLPF